MPLIIGEIDAAAPISGRMPLIGGKCPQRLLEFIRMPLIADEMDWNAPNSHKRAERATVATSNEKNQTNLATQHRKSTKKKQQEKQKRKQRKRRDYLLSDHL